MKLDSLLIRQKLIDTASVPKSSEEKITDSKHELSKVDSIKIKSNISDTLTSYGKNVLLNTKQSLKIDKDSLKSIKSQKDSLKFKAINTLKVKKTDFKLHGLLSNQFDYGMIPYYLPNTTFPTSFFKSQGDVKLSLKNIPFIFNYFYANPPGLFGIQNYYTLRFDADTYRQNIQNECTSKKAEYADKLNQSQKLRQEYAQKLAYYEAMQGYNGKAPVTNSLSSLPDNSLVKKDSSILNFDNGGFNLKNNLDTSAIFPNKNHKYNKIDSSKYKENLYIDSLLTKFNADSNDQKINLYKKNVEECDAKIKEYEQAIKFLNSNQTKDFDNPYLSKGKNILQNINKFEIGLCYPNYSTFLINNLTLKGVNIGYATKSYFINATYGKTVNTLLNPQNTNNKIINSFQNYSNFFDFNKNQDARKILAGKIGIGNESSSYLAFGALYGVGNKSYYQPTGLQEKNIVYEVDGKLSYKGYILYASIAKSFLNIASDGNQEQNVLSNNRNNALQIRFSGVIPYIKTKFNLGYRLVDPFFKSYGVGFIRTDNIRYEAKLEQVLSSKAKIGFNYRRDEDNILKRYGFKSNLNLLSITSKFKLFKKRVDLQLIYTPIFQKIENLNTHFIRENKSDMKNVVLAYTAKFKKTTTTITGIYNQYSLYDSIGIRNMENINMNILSILRNSLKLCLSSSYFNSNVRDSIAAPKTLLNSFETGYTFKNGVYSSFILKYSYNLTRYTNQYGAALNVNFPIRKCIFIELHAEKLIIGDFYNSLNVENINKFPYYCYSKLSLKF